MLAYVICHPCFTYGVQAWDRDERGEVTGIRLGNYFETGPRVQRWRFGAAPESEQVEPFTYPYFERTLGDLVNPLCAAGFRLEAIAEPRATEEACLAKPSLRKHQVIPHSLLLRARKPA